MLACLSGHPLGFMAKEELKSCVRPLSLSKHLSAPSSPCPGPYSYSNLLLSSVGFLAGHWPRPGYGSITL